jgi:UDP-N-acetylglucosamine 2-epimerase (non-hydrolysing)
VIDALLWVVGRPASRLDPVVDLLRDDPRRVLLVTAHRRESWGRPMAEAAQALAEVAAARPEVVVVFPLHRNPAVRDAVRPALAELPNVLLTEPLDYVSFAHLMNRATLVVTDSGGVQEEAPSLGRPVLVLRDNTERPEAVVAGTVQLVGTDRARIVTAVERLLDDRVAYEAMATAVNPYGDGRAAQRTVAALDHYFGLGPPAEEFRDPAVSPTTEPSGLAAAAMPALRAERLPAA